MLSQKEGEYLKILCEAGKELRGTCQEHDSSFLFGKIEDAVFWVSERREKNTDEKNY